MVVKKYHVRWTQPAQQNMHDISLIISRDSPINAARVIDDIFAAVDKADINPEIYPADKYKKNNNGKYRAFEKHNYRIIYRYTVDVIIVLWVRHTRRKPKIY